MYDRHRQHNQAGTFTALTRLAGQHGLGQHEAEALSALTRIVIVTGKDLRALSVDDLPRMPRPAARATGTRPASRWPMSW
jgi:hypothetical protein